MFDLTRKEDYSNAYGLKVGRGSYGHLFDA